MAIDGISSCASFHTCSGGSIDAEWARILARLREYGIKSSGSKTADTAKLRDLEMQELQTLKLPTNKFLTITKNEQQKIIEQKQKNNPSKQIKKEENKKDINQKDSKKTQQAMNILGEQIYLAIKMRNKKTL